ncbi:Transcription initiation factor TFIID subunit 12 [Halotydeus destructor]|nr:Transcription initiation factor TFIID subunit 12 [Halotydeus destructor]
MSTNYSPFPNEQSPNTGTTVTDVSSPTDGNGYRGTPPSPRLAMGPPSAMALTSHHFGNNSSQMHHQQQPSAANYPVNGNGMMQTGNGHLRPGMMPSYLATGGQYARGQAMSPQAGHHQQQQQHYQQQYGQYHQGPYSQQPINPVAGQQQHHQQQRHQQVNSQYQQQYHQHSQAYHHQQQQQLQMQQQQHLAHQSPVHQQSSPVQFNPINSQLSQMQRPVPHVNHHQQLNPRMTQNHANQHFANRPPPTAKPVSLNYNVYSEPSLRQMISPTQLDGHDVARQTSKQQSAPAMQYLQNPSAVQVNQRENQSIVSQVNQENQPKQHQHQRPFYGPEFYRLPEVNSGPALTGTSLGKDRLQQLVNEIDPAEQLDEDVEDMLLEMTDEFIETLVINSSKLAKHRGASTLEVKDVKMVLEKNYNIYIPGFGSQLTDLSRIKSHSSTTEAHRQRMALIKKTIKKC